MKNTNKKEESLESKDESVSSPRLYLNIKGGGENLSPNAHLPSLPFQPSPDSLRKRRLEGGGGGGEVHQTLIQNKPTPT